MTFIFIFVLSECLQTEPIPPFFFCVFSVFSVYSRILIFWASGGTLSPLKNKNLLVLDTVRKKFPLRGKKLH